MDTRETERILALQQLDALAVLDSKVADGLEHITHLASRHCDLLLMPLSDPLDHALPAAGEYRAFP